MGMYCELQQVSSTYTQKLLEEPDLFFDYLDDPESIEEGALGEDLSLDKAWHAMHYLLTGTAWGGSEPWNYLLAGGQTIGGEEHEFDFGPARILCSAHLRAFSQALRSMTSSVIAARFKPAEMEAMDIYPGIWSRTDEHLEEWLNEMFVSLRRFIDRALDTQRDVLIHIS